MEINTRSLENNYRFLRGLAGDAMECLAIVKADAYGHGLGICAAAVVAAGARWLGVTSVEEAVAARAACSGMGSAPRILAIGGLFRGQAAAVLEHGITCVVWEPSQLDQLEAAARSSGRGAQSVPVHVEIDTGMSRQGVDLDTLPQFLARFGAGSPLRIEALMTHLYASDEAHGEATAAQLVRVEQAVKVVCEAGGAPEYLSVGASAALLGGTTTDLRELAARWKMRPMLRLGLALYGVVPEFDPDFLQGEAPEALAAAKDNLQPVLVWKTQVVSVRPIPAGAAVGYNGTFVATEPMLVALIAVGYADGLDRRVGNRFSLLVRGQRAPLVGRISMDHAVLDVTDIPEVAPGDEVVILGTQDGEAITAFDHARAAGTIPWEVFTRISSRVPRMKAPGS